MTACMQCDSMATHEVDLGRGTAFPMCEGHAEDYRPERIRPITHYACSICQREIGREHPEPPLCRTCEGTAKAGGKALANAARYPHPEG